jgi:hypothetical protein
VSAETLHDALHPPDLGKAGLRGAFSGAVSFGVERRRNLVVGLASILVLLAPSFAAPVELREETVKAWDEYILAANLEMEDRLHQKPFLWVDETSERSQQVRAGKILVSPAASQMPKSVPGGLIHDWVAAAFIPHATLDDVLAVVRDYDHYKVFYKPSVVDSRTLGATGGGEDRFAMLLANKEVVATIALDTEYQACYQQPATTQLYSAVVATRVQEIRDYGRAEEHKMQTDHGSGYIWRLASFSRFEERDGGVYAEVEAMALSREIPTALRWLVSPIVRSISRSALVASLRQTQEAVHSVTTQHFATGERRLTMNSCSSALALRR